MSSSFENFDFFSKKDDLRITANRKYSAKLNNSNNQPLKSFKDIFKDINTLSESEEVKPQKE
ncbi:MAG: hypothetical protein EBR67_05965 [Proteobacteria bacterium]|jgi:hypothetical protein|nr:hypothetical protein [Pseudomonadota bacterium]